MFRFLFAFKLLLVSALMSLSPLASADDADPVKVVYHMSEGIPQASRAINNIRNHLNAAPDTKIVVVAHGLGIDFLLDGATNQMEQPFAGAMRIGNSKGPRKPHWELGWQPIPA